MGTSDWLSVPSLQGPSLHGTQKAAPAPPGRSELDLLGKVSCPRRPEDFGEREVGSGG